jgi:hypothetical protein
VTVLDLLGAVLRGLVALGLLLAGVGAVLVGVGW